MAGSKHDADCLRRKEDPAMLYVCTCGLADEQVVRPGRYSEAGDRLAPVEKWPPAYMKGDWGG